MIRKRRTKKKHNPNPNSFLIFQHLLSMAATWPCRCGKLHLRSTSKCLTCEGTRIGFFEGMAKTDTGPWFCLANTSEGEMWSCGVVHPIPDGTSVLRCEMVTSRPPNPAGSTKCTLCGDRRASTDMRTVDWACCIMEHAAAIATGVSVFRIREDVKNAWAELNKVTADPKWRVNGAPAGSQQGMRKQALLPSILLAGTNCLRYRTEVKDVGSMNAAVIEEALTSGKSLGQSAIEVQARMINKNEDPSQALQGLRSVSGTWSRSDCISYNKILTESKTIAKAGAKSLRSKKNPPTGKKNLAISTIIAQSQVANNPVEGDIEKEKVKVNLEENPNVLKPSYASKVIYSSRDIRETNSAKISGRGGGKGTKGRNNDKPAKTTNRDRKTVTTDTTNSDSLSAVAFQQTATAPSSAANSPSVVAAPARPPSCESSVAMSTIMSSRPAKLLKMHRYRNIKGKLHPNF